MSSDRVIETFPGGYGFPAPVSQAHHLRIEERRARGRELRGVVPRARQALWEAPADRPDPVRLLELDAADRLPQLVPLRFGRMLASPFAYMRGAVTAMTVDLASTPKSGIAVQICGDAHIGNFGVGGDETESLRFDLNDFDETTGGPWEWDLKRLAASAVVSARVNGASDVLGRDIAAIVARAYQSRMLQAAEMTNLEVWRSRIDVAAAVRGFPSERTRRRARKMLETTRTRHDVRALDRLTAIQGEDRRFVDQPPLIERIESDRELERMLDLDASYRRSLAPDRRGLLDQHRFVDAARRVSGIGSVGRRCFLLLLEGKDLGDPLFISIKEARSAAATRPGPEARGHDGERIALGQRLMQWSGDPFVGWASGADGRRYTCRQQVVIKLSPDVEGMTMAEMQIYAEFCGWALALAHARSGDRIQIASYLGSGDRFESAIADFAVAYADQTERDYLEFTKAVKSGRIDARADG